MPWGKILMEINPPPSSRPRQGRRVFVQGLSVMVIMAMTVYVGKTI
jgi:hypothetical protein